MNNRYSWSTFCFDTCQKNWDRVIYYGPYPDPVPESETDQKSSGSSRIRIRNTDYLSKV
jgi:hypothetical protein